MPGATSSAWVLVKKPILPNPLGTGMAYRKSNGKLARRKMEPAVTTMFFNTTAQDPGTVSEHYLDLSQCASICNRRFYRQGINWVVGSIKIIAGASGSVTVMKLPQTWVMKNAWVKAMANWRKMIDESLEEGESLRGRFMDFKIFADSGHHAVGFDANLLPKTFGVSAGAVTESTAQPGEWIHSKFIIPRTDGSDQANTRDIIAVGANYPGVSGITGNNAVSLIEGYAASRGLPYQEDPNTPADAQNAAGGTPQNWMVALHNDGTVQDAAVITDATTENDQAPYPFEGDAAGNVDTQYPGGQNQLSELQVHDVVAISGTTVGSMTYVKGGEFPCGLIKFIHSQGAQSGNLAIQIDLVPGPHRGYMCESMGA